MQDLAKESIYLASEFTDDGEMMPNCFKLGGVEDETT